MTLPEIRLPSSLPLFRSQGHTHDLRDPYANVPNASGHVRRRRTQIREDRIVTFDWLLDAQQEATFNNFYENTLEAGARTFSAQVAGDGPGLLWYEALILDLVDEPRTAYQWHVYGRLRLRGEGSVTGPVVTGLALQVGLVLNGSAALQADSALVVRVALVLGGDEPLALRVSLELNVVFNSYRLREALGFRMREGGGKRKRET